MNENNNYEQYAKAIKDELSLIEQYNSKIFSFGYVDFFALATYIKEWAPKPIFVCALISMSVSATIFAAYELFRNLYYIRYKSNKAKAIENLPEENILRFVHNYHQIVELRIQK